MTALTCHLPTLVRRRILSALALSALAFALNPTLALAEAADPPLRDGRLSISGMGATPSGRVTLVLGPQASLSTNASKEGAFSFVPIPYDFNADLSFKLVIPVNDPTKKEALKNTIALKIRPTAFTVDAEGYATKAASIALNVGGDAAATGVASDTAYFKLSSPSRYSSMSPASTKILASIINVREECCPRSFIPGEPVTVLVQNVPSVPPAQTRASSTTAPLIVTPPAAAKEEAPDTTTTAEEPASKLPKPGTPVGPRNLLNKSKEDSTDNRQDKSGQLTSGQVIQTGSVIIPSAAYASVDGTWVNGLRQVSTQVVQVMMLQARMIGGFIDAQVNLDSQRALQKLHAEAIKDYTPGEALCKFGTLSRSLAASDSRSLATKAAVNEILIDRDTMRSGSLYASTVGDGEAARVRMFAETFCSRIEESNGLDRFCTLSTDMRFNRDIDYTRVIDTPLTLGVNFLGGATAAQQVVNANVIALSNNLLSNEPFKGFNLNDFEAGEVLSDDLQDYRSVIAARGVVRNSFASLVGTKAAGTGASNTYMRAVLTQMGMSTADADRLLGVNPSYFAQMEVLTKKIYQDPRFFAELYDKPANVDRQRAAMRGINLTQQADLLEVLRRREMLLSVLLELKLQNLDEKKSK